MNKQDYVGLRSRGVESVKLPGGAVGYVRVMSGAERFAWYLASSPTEDGSQDKNPNPPLLARCLCDASGTRVFGDGPEDVAAIANMDGVVLELLTEAAMRVNGLSDEAKDAIKKNCDAAVSSDSYSI